MLHTDEWSALERLMNLLVLAIGGLDAHARDFMLERDRDVTPLVRLAWDLREALEELQRKTLREATFLPARPVELADMERQLADQAP